MNVVLIALDSLRSDHLGCYGYAKNTSPVIDELARHGVLYERCFAPNIPTHPSFTTMLSGREAISHNIVNIDREAQLEPGIRLLPEILQQHGYTTVAIDNMDRHFRRGFDRYASYEWETSDPAGLRKAEAVVEIALPLINELQSHTDPFFLFVHFWDPHTPYLPPFPYRDRFYEAGSDPYDPGNHSMDEAWSWEPFKWYFHEWIPGVTDAAYVNSLYDGEIAYMDQHLRRIFDALGPRIDDTLVIVTADHGEVLNDQLGYYDHHGLYDTNIRVPLIFCWPGKLPAGRRVPGFVQNVDIAPTILDMAGIPGHRDMEGQSLVASLLGLRDGNYDELYCSEATWELKRAVRTERWKLIDSLEPDPHGRPMQELFDLRADPDEQYNAHHRFPDVAHDLRTRLHAWVTRRLEDQSRAVDPLLEHGTCASRIGTPVHGETPGAGATPSRIWRQSNERSVPQPERVQGKGGSRGDPDTMIDR